ncbi:MAG: hypothetical protein JNK23_10450 [Opitutaceae bacterium]|nr:hypothetical protein [Opitutaceae bacterium]
MITENLHFRGTLKNGKATSEGWTRSVTLTGKHVGALADSMLADATEAEAAGDVCRARKIRFIAEQIRKRKRYTVRNVPLEAGR